MPELREIAIQFPDDVDHCKLIAKHLQSAGFVEMARQIQLAIRSEPAIEEPTEFGSLIRATEPHGRRLLWQADYRSGAHYWQGNDGTIEVWPELTDVEVLRVGLGDDRPLQVLLEDTQRDAFALGRRDMAAGIHYRLQNLLGQAITSERKNALEKAIQAVEELAP